MASDWRADKRETDLYLPYAKRILSDFLLREATEEEDAQENTDLRTLVLGEARVGIRLRRPKLLKRHPEYADQFTIRYSRRKGVLTEYEKILQGWGHYFLYGWMGDKIGRCVIVHWTLLDLSAFREWVSLYVKSHGKHPGEQISNGDNSSDFLAFWLTGESAVPDHLTISHQPYFDFMRSRPARLLPRPEKFAPETDGQIRFFF